MCLVAAAAALCAFIAPATVGSGIPEVKAYLNGVDAQNILAPSTLFVKGGSPKYHLTCTWLRCFKNDRDWRGMITCGLLPVLLSLFVHQ
ncbi:hypothetical protein GLYMA_17G189751v4 [Glycine max]|nr:hypothetical protein GLYMA_17G189751v4 [Glycine max]KAH1119121.1 hypothetical protein GYH30_047782 [Glycine max]